MQLYHGTQVQTRFYSDRTVNAATINFTRQIPGASANLRRSFQYLPDICAHACVRAGMREKVWEHLLLEYLTFVYRYYGRELFLLILYEFVPRRASIGSVRTCGL